MIKNQEVLKSKGFKYYSSLVNIMNLNTILEEELKRVKITSDEKKYLEHIAQKVIETINKKLKRKNIDASVFIGGSLAKNTIVRQKKYDIDLFLRFNPKYSEKEIKKYMFWIFFLFKIPNMKTNVKRIHGSRDYIKINFKKENNVSIEVIPIIKVTNPEEARNITDLSYFHVKYIKDRFKKDKTLADQIILAKSFCYGQKCYGAESYINGFSGYALELIVIYYCSFIKFLKEIVKSQAKIIIDSEKLYKNKEDIITHLNKAKKQSPIILIDPTFKERNATASLSYETFEKFKKSAEYFIENPSQEYFMDKKININELKRKAHENDGIFARIEIKTNKQPGDIAGTKLLKFSKIFIKEVSKYNDIINSEFEYNDEKKANIYLVLKKKTEIVNVGPLMSNYLAVEKFKKAHPIWYTDDGKIKCSLNTDINIRDIIKKFKKKDKKMIKEMAVKKIKLAEIY